MEPDEENNQHRPLAARQWIIAALSGAGAGASGIDLVYGSQEPGVWFALVASGLVCLASIFIAINFARRQ